MAYDAEDDQLPRGWAWARLGELGIWTGGGTPAKANPAFWTNGTVPWVSAKDMKVDTIGEVPDLVTEEAVLGSAAKLIPANSLLMVTRSGILRHTFPVAVTDRTVTVNQDLKALTPAMGVEPRYLQRFLQLRNNRILSLCSKDGTTVASIEMDGLAGLPIPIAPSGEQHRIIEAIDALFGEIDAGEQELDQALLDLAVYRRSVLKSAVTGELTGEWRRRNAHVETGHEFLARVLGARAKARNGSRMGRANQQEATAAEPPISVPNSWAWATMADLCELSGGVTVDGKRAGKDLIEVPYLRVANVQRGSLDLNIVKTIRVSRDRIEQLRLVPNDVLLNEGGDRDKVGRGWVWSGEIDPCIHQNHVFRARPYSSEVDGRFLSLYANEIGRSYFFSESKQTTNLASLGIGKVAALPVPLPPRDELKLIVEIAMAALEACDEMEKTLVEQGEVATSLRKAVLNAAFSGRLAPQDPADESASILLERLRATQARAPRRGRKHRV